MKTRPQDYAPWLLGQTVEDYCNASVMPLGAEIDNVGLSALKDAFLSPAGITLEVLYLDRSEGSEVNMHRFDPVNHNGLDVGTIRLLYRPYVQSLCLRQNVVNGISGDITTCSTNLKTCRNHKFQLSCRHIFRLTAIRIVNLSPTSALMTA